MQSKIFFIILSVVIAVTVSGYMYERSHAVKVYHIGILSGLDAFASSSSGFKNKMTELGYIEGKNVVYEEVYHDNDRNADQLTLKHFVEENVDLIFVFPTIAAIDARAATVGTHIPVVFDYGGTDDKRLVDSIAHPGGNLTGLRYSSAELATRHFELLHELMPKLKRLWIIYDPQYPTTERALSALIPITATSGISLIETKIANMDELKLALDEMGNAKDLKVDAILIMPEMLTQSSSGARLIADFARAHKLPIAGNTSFDGDRWAVFSYIPDTIETGRMAALMADKIFHGIDPSNIPIETPEAYLRFNYPLAKSLGLTVSEGFLSRANFIIK